MGIVMSRPEHEREHAYEDIKRDVAEHKENNDNHARASAAPPTLAGAPPAGSHQQGEHQHENLGGDTKYADQAYQVDGNQEHYDIVMSRPEHEREHAYEEIKRDVAEHKDNSDNHARASAAPAAPLAGAPPAGSHQQGEHQHENL